MCQILTSALNALRVLGLDRLLSPFSKRRQRLDAVTDTAPAEDALRPWRWRIVLHDLVYECALAVVLVQ